MLTFLLTLMRYPRQVYRCMWVVSYKNYGGIIHTAIHGSRIVTNCFADVKRTSEVISKIKEIYYTE